MNGIYGLDASLKLEYVLELPLDRALTLRNELLRMGVPDNWIKVIEPSTSTIKANRGQKNNTGRVIKQKLQGDGSSESRQRGRTIRFLPNSIKLGTCAEGQYNVAIRRRTKPEGRETLWISMAVPKVVTKVVPGVDQAVMTAVSNDEGEQFAKTNTMIEVMVHENDGAGGGDGGDKNDKPMTIQQCNCADANCDDYKNVLRKCFIDNDHNGRDIDEFSHAHKCIYKRIADMLLVVTNNHNGGCDGQRGNESVVDSGGGGDGDSGRSSVNVCVKPSDEQPSEDNNVDTDIESATRLTTGGRSSIESESGDRKPSLESNYCKDYCEDDREIDSSLAEICILNENAFLQQQNLTSSSQSQFENKSSELLSDALTQVEVQSYSGNKLTLIPPPTEFTTVDNFTTDVNTTTDNNTTTDDHSVTNVWTSRPFLPSNSLTKSVGMVANAKSETNNKWSKNKFFNKLLRRDKIKSTVKLPELTKQSGYVGTNNRSTDVCLRGINFTGSTMSVFNNKNKAGKPKNRKLVSLKECI